MKVGIVYDPIYLKHDTGDHPESPRRLRAILYKLQETGLWKKLEHIVPKPASDQDLLRVHSEKHVEYIRRLASEGGGRVDADTVVSRHSFDSAVYAAGGVVTALEAVVSGEVNSAFALVRPPGHHSTRDRAMGFCLFNNVAMAAAYALEKYKFNRVLILDFDVHHGNGTQDIFEREPRVSYISVHESPLYPGSGAVCERGVGNIFNVPLPPFSGADEYIRIYDEIVMPVASRFKPEIILVSAGFDAHWRDEIASMRLSISGYSDILRRINALAGEFCKGRVVLSLEGGYDPEALSSGVEAVFDVLLGAPDALDLLGTGPVKDIPPDIEPLLRQLKDAFELI